MQVGEEWIAACAAFEDVAVAAGPAASSGGMADGLLLQALLKRGQGLDFAGG